MMPLPTDPLALQSRTIAALCEDLFDIGTGRSRSFDRLEGIRQVLIERKSTDIQRRLG